MVTAQIEDLGSYQKVYLDRHFPQRMAISELMKLPRARIKAYLKKHRSLEFMHKHDNYNYSLSDLEYNGYFGTNVEQQFKDYFASVKSCIDCPPDSLR